MGNTTRTSSVCAALLSTPSSNLRLATWRSLDQQTLIMLWYKHRTRIIVSNVTVKWGNDLSPTALLEHMAQTPQDGICSSGDWQFQRVITFVLHRQSKWTVLVGNLCLHTIKNLDFMHEALSLVRKIWADRMVETQIPLPHSGIQNLVTPWTSSHTILLYLPLITSIEVFWTY